jgi:RimJ/RimL family protein N-acetyltransferase
MRRFIFDKARVNDWIWRRVGRESPFGPERAFCAIGVEEDGELIAGVIFDSFATGIRCSMHTAGVGKRWCSRTLLRMCFEYAFITAGVKVIVNTVAADNEESIRLTTRIGFKEVGRVPDGATDSDLIIYALHRNDCRWLGGTYEKSDRLAA